MSMDDEQPGLKRQFDRLREADAADAPEFDQVWSAAVRKSAAAPPSWRPGFTAWFASATILACACIAVTILIPSPNQQTNNVHSAPDSGAPASEPVADADPILAEWQNSGLATWKSPTAMLLAPPGLTRESGDPSDMGETLN